MSLQPDPVALLQAWTAGDRTALDALMPLVYQELRRIASHYLRGERTDHTLQTTALVHEAYLKLVNYREVPWSNRNLLLGLAAQTMRRVLVNHAEARNASKRGGGHEQVSLTLALEVATQPPVEIMALDEALTKLESLDPRQGRIVEMRYFGGLTVEETADVLDISPATVKREWQIAKIWLHRALSAPGSLPS